MSGGAEERADAAAAPADLFNRSAIYRFSFAFAAFVFVVDMTNLVGISPYAVAIKYVYTAVAAALLYHYYSRFVTISVASTAPLLALAFFVATGLVYVANLRRGIEVSYITAFTASLVFAAAVFIPAGGFAVDADRTCRDLRMLLLLGSICYLVEASLKASGLASSVSYAVEIEHVKSIVCVMGLSLSVLMRSRQSMFLFAAIAAASIVVRPSSTLLVASAICVPLAFALRAGLRRTYAAASWSALVLAAATPWLFYWFFDSIAEFAEYGERSVKEGLLEGHSNTDFRLEIFKLALRSLDNSLLFGQGLSGNPNVDLGAQWPWWHEVIPDGTALIHSDWLVIVAQAGMVGAALFFLMFASILKLRLRALAMLAAGGSQAAASLLSLSIVACVAFFLYSSFNPVLPLYHIAHGFWFVLLVSEIVARGVVTVAQTRTGATEPAPAPQPA
jgi:hypothetical protein